MANCNNVGISLSTNTKAEPEIFSTSQNSITQLMTRRLKYIKSTMACGIRRTSTFSKSSPKLFLNMLKTPMTPTSMLARKLKGSRRFTIRGQVEEPNKRIWTDIYKKLTKLLAVIMWTRIGPSVTWKDKIELFKTDWKKYKKEDVALESVKLCDWCHISILINYEAE